MLKFTVWWLKRSLLLPIIIRKRLKVFHNKALLDLAPGFLLNLMVFCLFLSCYLLATLAFLLNFEHIELIDDPEFCIPCSLCVENSSTIFHGCHSVSVLKVLLQPSKLGCRLPALTTLPFSHHEVFSIFK